MRKVVRGVVRLVVRGVVCSCGLGWARWSGKFYEGVIGCIEVLVRFARFLYRFCIGFI